MRKDPRVYLLHMLECIRRIEAYTSEGEERFMRDTLIQDAVLRNLQVLGEAAKRVPESFRKRHPNIAWRGISGMRDVITHDYEGVDFSRVWQVVKHDLPILKQAILEILPEPESVIRELTGDPQSPAGE